MSINIGPGDGVLTVTMPLPAAAANNTTGILDLQSIAPNSDSWRLGRIAVIIPALPENNTGAGITFALQAAPPSLTTSPKAPGFPVPGTFVTPICAQTITVPSVATTGSVATVAYFTLAFDANGSPYQFYQFLQTVPSGVITTAEIITFQWING